MYAKSLIQGLARSEHLINGYCCRRLNLCVASCAHHPSSSLHAPPCWALPFPLLPLPLILLSPSTPGSQALPSRHSLSPAVCVSRCCSLCVAPSRVMSQDYLLWDQPPLGRRFLLFSVLPYFLATKLLSLAYTVGSLRWRPERWTWGLVVSALWPCCLGPGLLGVCPFSGESLWG